MRLTFCVPLLHARSALVGSGLLVRRDASLIFRLAGPPSRGQNKASLRMALEDITDTSGAPGGLKWVGFFGASFVPSLFLAGYFLGGYFPGGVEPAWWPTAMQVPAVAFCCTRPKRLWLFRWRRRRREGGRGTGVRAHMTEAPARVFFELRPALTRTVPADLLLGSTPTV